MHRVRRWLVDVIADAIIEADKRRNVKMVEQLSAQLQLRTYTPPPSSRGPIARF